MLPSNVFASNNYKNSSKLVNIILNEKPTLSINPDNTKLEYPIVAGKKLKHPTPKGIFTIKKIVHKPNWYLPQNSSWVKNTKKYMEYINNTNNIDENGHIFVPYGHPLHPLSE